MDCRALAAARPAPTRVFGDIEVGRDLPAKTLVDLAIAIRHGGVAGLPDERRLDVGESSRHLESLQLHAELARHLRSGEEPADSPASFLADHELLAADGLQRADDVTNAHLRRV